MHWTLALENFQMKNRGTLFFVLLKLKAEICAAGNVIFENEIKKFNFDRKHTHTHIGVKISN